MNPRQVITIDERSTNILEETPCLLCSRPRSLQPGRDLCRSNRAHPVLRCCRGSPGCRICGVATLSPWMKILGFGREGDTPSLKEPQRADLRESSATLGSEPVGTKFTLAHTILLCQVDWILALERQFELPRTGNTPTSLSLGLRLRTKRSRCGTV